MARNFAGGTDRATFGGNIPAVASTDLFAVAFRMRTTLATANVQVISRWTSSSRAGFAFLLNNTANKLTLVGYDAGSQRLIIAGATSVTTGAWFNVVANMNPANGGANQFFVNGISDGTGNSSAAWLIINASDHVVLGDSFDAFWNTYNGDYADVGYWHGVHLSADDIAAYNSGIGVQHIKPASLKVDAPLFRDLVCRRQGAAGNVSASTAVDHPRVIA